jgi:hypothetical protein
MKNKKSIIKFITIFILTFLLMEGVEFTIENLFNIDLSELKWGWIGFIIVYSFKYHIFCCLIPALWAGYKCRHKNCEHEHCEHK